MRKDMAKVIVERPRRGSHFLDKEHRYSNRDDEGDSFPLKESMRKRYANRKSLNENLRPLERFLNSKIGHRWSKVYSEINEHINVSSAVQAHIRQHLKHMVVLDSVKGDDGNRWVINQFSLTYLSVGRLYVEDGIIKVVKKIYNVKPKLPKGYKKYLVVAVPVRPATVTRHPTSPRTFVREHKREPKLFADGDALPHGSVVLEEVWCGSFPTFNPDDFVTGSGDYAWYKRFPLTVREVTHTKGA